MTLARTIALDVGTGFARAATRRRAGWRERRAPDSAHAVIRGLRKVMRPVVKQLVDRP